MKKNYLHVISLFVLAFLLIHCKDDDDSLPADDGPPTQVEDPNPDIISFTPALGKKGIQVTLKGVDFDAEPGGNTVRFNGVASQIDTASETTLVVTVPENATTGKITLESHGKTYTSFQDFTVLLPPPIISDFQPKEGVEGDEVTITGENFGEDASAVIILFHGSDPVEIQSISDNKIVVMAPDAYSGPIQMGVKDQYTITSDDFTYLPWRQMKDFEQGRRWHGLTVVINDKIYIGLGYVPDSNLADLWEYDPKTDSWKQMADFIGTERTDPFSFVIDGHLYIGAGDDGVSTEGPNDFYRFDPNTNTWTQLDDFPGNPNQMREVAATFTINGKGYVYGGRQGIPNTPIYNDLWEYDPKLDTWKEKNGFETAGRTGAVGFSLNSKGYIGLGYKVDLLLNDLWEYNPIDDTWIEKTSLPEGMERYGARSFTIDNKAYVGMGNHKTDFWEFNPEGNGTWKKKSDFPDEARFWPFAAQVNGKAYIGFGRDDSLSYLKDIWEYTPAHDQ
ncbi:Kelch repeat-containing protein [Flagellimonas flava]|uniref:Galactose oxidase, central domain n=1 Tax=Flagellimonas flava TaxID=570519 RepID=A0A1M5MIL0_9FLAO|nr:IPT/TIG domain-containing protein [Allomuricauda flava]SHG76769.1 Galactose oxidase, central domain [Allomuricauda flava]